MGTTLEALITLITRARNEHLRRKAAVSEFQRLVWEGLDPSIPEGVRDVLRELAHDFDYFESDPEVRKEDPKYYGHARLERECDEALRKLNALGIENLPIR